MERIATNTGFLRSDCGLRADDWTDEHRLMRDDWRLPKGVLAGGGAARRHTYIVPAGMSARAAMQEASIPVMFYGLDAQWNKFLFVDRARQT